MLEIIFLSDGKISDTDIPSRISKQISTEKNVNILFYTLSIPSIFKIYLKIIIYFCNNKKLIINTHHFKGALFVFLFINLFKNNLFKNIKWFHTLHSEFYRYKGLKKFLVCFIYSKCNHLIGVNPQVSFKWSQSLRNKKVTTINNGISKKEFSTIINKNIISSSKIKILWVGRFEYIKNPSLIIKTAYNLDSSNPIEIIIIGKGKLLVKIKKEIDIFNKISTKKNIKIIFLSNIERSKVLEEFATSKIYVNTSYSEAFCTTALEALVNPYAFLFLPNLLSMKALYNYKNVAFYEKNNDLDLARQINKFISRPINLNPKPSYEKFPKEFTLESTAKKYINYYLDSFN